MLFVTGLGNTVPPPGEGDAAPVDKLAWSQIDVRVLVAGMESPRVDFHGLTPGLAGLYQINFQVPNTPVTGLVDVQIIVDGRLSNTTKIFIG